MEVILPDARSLSCRFVIVVRETCARAYACCDCTGDAVGFVLAFVSLTPFAVIVAFVTLIAFKRELDTVMFLLGQLTNEMLNMLLKNTIREQRPENAIRAMHTPHTYGMPSNHSQFQSFFTTFSILFVIMRMRHKSFGFRFLLMAGLTSSCAAVLYSRSVSCSESDVLSDLLSLSEYTCCIIRGLRFWSDCWSVSLMHVCTSTCCTTFSNPLISIPFCACE